MPQIHRVSLLVPPEARPQPDHLHAVISRWLDEEHGALDKPYSLGRFGFAADGLFHFEVGLLDDGLVSRLRNGAEAGARGIRLGTHKALTAPLGGLYTTLVDHAEWDALPPALSRIEQISLTFRTPTTFRENQAQLAVPDPGRILGWYRSRWARYAPSHLVPACDFPISVVDLDVRTRKWPTRVSGKVGFEGTLVIRMATQRASNAQHRDLARLVSVAPYSGTGANTSRGMGRTQVDVVASAEPDGPVESGDGSGKPAGRLSGGPKKS